MHEADRESNAASQDIAAEDLDGPAEGLSSSALKRKSPRLASKHTPKIPQSDLASSTSP